MTPEDAARPESGTATAGSGPPAVATPERSDYDERYFATGLGLPYDESQPHWWRFFGDIADRIVKGLAPASVLDAGCAKGFLVAALAERGVDARGLDVSQYAVDSAVRGAEGRLAVGSLTDPLDGRWDLVTCIEVLEHMSPEQTQRAIDNICAVTESVLLSSTPHDFVEPSHVNVRPVATWASWFAERGFFRRTDLDLSSISPWAAVFERRSLTPAGVAYLYETEAAPLREEAAVKRSALLDAERRIADLEAKLEAARHPSARDLTVEPDRTTERVIALTDEVIGLRSELGALRYNADLEIWAATVEADDRRKQAEAGCREAEARAMGAEARLEEVLASRTWRYAQALHRASPLRRLLRRRP